MKRSWKQRMAFAHHLRTSMFLPLSPQEVFNFFAHAENLERITPPELSFHVTTPTPVIMQEGTLIDYRLKLFRIPFGWQTVISRWNPPHLFVDEQLRGPYAAWVHTHRFQERSGGTIVSDEVCYQLPFSPLGEIAFPLVRLQLHRIFQFRQKAIEKILLS